MAHRHQTPSRRPHLESLEDRLALSLTSASVGGGTLYLSCNNAPSRVVVGRSNGYVIASDETNKFVRRFPAASVSRVQFTGGASHDCFNDAVPGLPAVAFGKGGSDSLRGNTAADRMYGGPGPDFIGGRGGNDQIWGEGGSDYILAGAGNTKLYGGRDNDYVVHDGKGVARIWGGHGNDALKGGTGNDFIWGEGDDDSLLGRAGNDQLDGGDGDDLLLGGGNNDDLDGGGDDDDLFGEGGVDTLAGGEGDDWLEAGSAQESADGGLGTDWNAHVWEVVGATIDDVLQRPNTGSCAFLASLASVARHDAGLGARITYKGYYQYRVELPGVGVQEVFFDGNVTSVDPMFRIEGESWVILFQRAFQQHTGSAAIGTALTTLTGRPSFTRGPEHGPPRVEDVAHIEAQLGSGEVVVGTPVGPDPSDPFATLAAGLVYDHAYTVLSVTRDAAGQPAYVRLRDPAGWYLDIAWADFVTSIDAIVLN